MIQSVAYGDLFKLLGMTDTIQYFQAEAEINWIKKHQPEIWEKTDKYVLLSGFLTYKLTGKLIDSTGCQVAYIPFDYKNQDWAKPSDWKWDAVAVKPEMLPELVPLTQVLGTITKAASQATGIPEGLPLIATASDKATEVIGAGCLEPNIGCLSFGTTATINTTHKKYIEVIPLIPLPCRCTRFLFLGSSNLSRFLDGELVQRRVWAGRTTESSQLEIEPESFLISF